MGLYDEVHLERTAEDLSIEVVGPALGPEEENLAYRAAQLLIDRVNCSDGVRIRLTKNIPTGAGLGGGSSDAGATLRALNVLLGDPLSSTQLLELAGKLGSDVPFFTEGSGAALAWGRGERLVTVPTLEDTHVVLALPPVSVSTALAYRELPSYSATEPIYSRPSRGWTISVVEGVRCQRLRTVHFPPSSGTGRDSGCYCKGRGHPSHD